MTKTTYRHRIGRMYQAVVGYNPFEDDPSMPTVDGAKLFRGYLEVLRDEGGLDARQILASRETA